MMSIAQWRAVYGCSIGRAGSIAGGEGDVEIRDMFLVEGVSEGEFLF